MPARKKITADELAKHNTEKDAWMAIHGLVLDLNKDFLDEHPGGPDVVTCLAGRDATQDFEDISHSDSAREWASKMIIGYMEGAEDEDAAKTDKMIPKNSEVGGSGGGGLSSVFPAIVVVIIAAAAYFFMKVK
eukprot:TRINITY_DN68855_c0_g1_i1.p1 TRINITY_DN68855_c0_g1~~TRINITY_DN68855_c0_g1_i1.p1  ORF type:complete len:133 (+),score=43.68 TRINITY_DN68855_c0_g1_i1:80-478(+)